MERGKRLDECYSWFLLFFVPGPHMSRFKLVRPTQALKTYIYNSWITMQAPPETVEVAEALHDSPKYSDQPPTAALEVSSGTWYLVTCLWWSACVAYYPISRVLWQLLDIYSHSSLLTLLLQAQVAPLEEVGNEKDDPLEVPRRKRSGEGFLFVSFQFCSIISPSIALAPACFLTCGGLPYTLQIYQDVQEQPGRLVRSYRVLW